MPSEPQITAMSMRQRFIMFWLLVVVFLLALPVMIFYTTGYRLSFDDDTTNIVTTGGMYVDTSSAAVEVYLDEAPVTRPRLFRSAYYIQNVPAGQHRVVVQGDSVHTWVKELPVDPHIVTEAAAFNVPVVTQLRPITQYQDSAGRSVYAPAATSSIWGVATATEPFVIATTTATTSYSLNPEYEFVVALFASSSHGTTSVLVAPTAPERFRFTASTSVATATPTTTALRERSNIQLIVRDQQIVAQWVGDEASVPYYFCVSSSSRATTSVRYGTHVAEQIFSALASTTATSSLFVLNEDRICRQAIQLNRLQEDVYEYQFFPGSSDLVLLHLASGLYVTEIDDRAWQNTQPLLLGDDFVLLLENDVIYIKRGEYYFELVPELAAN